MIFIPLPFVVALLLVILLAQMIRSNEADLRENIVFMTLMAAYALQSVLIGIRWGYDVRAMMPVQSVLATLIAPLAWIAFSGLTKEPSEHRLARLWPHLLPACLVALLLIFWREPVGPVIILVFLSYGLALLWLALAGPDVLVESRLDGALRSYRSLWVTALAILASPVTDIIISFDMQWTGGIHSGAVIAGGNVLALLLLGGAAAVASETAAPDEEEVDGSQTAPRATSEDSAIAAAVDVLMRSKELYKDVDLNLGRIARRLGLPARQVSSAINRIHGSSVSQYVNNQRIDEARRLLATTDEPITRIMFDAGFLSKSNFNREFLRITGLSPKAWRLERQPPGDAMSATSLSDGENNNRAAPVRRRRVP
ncbi:AraC family transcriptional regulator [Mesorhizobium sp. PAMC28654]|uniref:helix-turn-helix domain-containing protein n=1 Tax=Mesorhizobium sp. PAMC28654 TaxID=2880934 RepID=UPI001D0B219A|nr:AraC family transcriptional regulator [Mesorhizobium sp. PAMC28654]UDL87819.1 AraC family transcriptional regulator [Mesorhizobium sp. PAMC28654]